ncbi:REXO4 exonuclease, partial [Psilopogon haemacephalus]|nr:REXO4 exonuclease [Psilopogon haemacephalus]
LLKQKTNSSNESLPACQTHPTKKHPGTAGNSQEGSAVNGKVKAKSSPKTDNASAKGKPPLAKPGSKGVVVAEGKVNGTKSEGKGCKEKKKNGKTVQEEKKNGNTPKEEEKKKSGSALKEKEKRPSDNTVKEKEDIKHKRRKAEEAVEQPPKEAEIWFDDVDPRDIEAAIGPEAAKIARRNLGLEADQSVERVLVKERAFEGLTRAVAMDCEMVGVGPKGEDSIVARVSIVNQFGKCIYDKYVKPTEEVTDYRTAVSGIRPHNVKSGEDFKTVQKEVANILNGRILVGHALRNDLKVLFLDHPQKKIRDTQRYKPFKERVKSSRPSLKLLCEKLLNIRVQTSEHSSV